MQTVYNPILRPTQLGGINLTNPVLEISSISTPTFLVPWLVEKSSSFERTTHK